MDAQTSDTAAGPASTALPVTPLIPVAPITPTVIFSRFPLLAPLAFRAYALFWLATVFMYVSDNFRSLAGASIALDLTGRPSGLSTLQTIGTIPNVLIMLFGGLAADRFRPHRVVLASLMVTTTVAAAMASLSFFGLLAYWHLVVFTLVGGLAGGLANGAFFAVLPDLLPGDRLRSANALGSTTESLSRFLIPPLAGLILTAAGLPPTLALGAVTVFAAAAILGSIRVPPRPPANSAHTDPQSTSPSPAGVLARQREGLVASRADGAVWTLIWAGAVLVPGSFGATATGIPPLAKLTLAAGDSGIGILYGGLGAGALCGALAAGTVRAVGRPGLVIVLGALGEGLALAATGFAPTLWLAAATLACAGLFQAVRFVLALTVIQSRTAPAVRGRVTSLAVLFAVVPQIAVFAGAGYVGDVLGARSIMIVGGTLVVLAAALIASQKSIRSLTAN
ncbi:MAG TPA: MFS transporter [Chloroflexota bacterium]|nr:MFS transporter [Chloroflexota bacterium]